MLLVSIDKSRFLVPLNLYFPQLHELSVHLMNGQKATSSFTAGLIFAVCRNWTTAALESVFDDANCAARMNSWLLKIAERTTGSSLSPFKSDTISTD